MGIETRTAAFTIPQATIPQRPLHKLKPTILKEKPKVQIYISFSRPTSNSTHPKNAKPQVVNPQCNFTCTKALLYEGVKRFACQIGRPSVSCNRLMRIQSIRMCALQPSQKYKAICLNSSLRHNNSIVKVYQGVSLCILDNNMKYCSRI